ncbi:P-type conjugative transfer protein TrbJ [Escherichia coli]|jgi:P-type conjugative transfer protein TrbJ|uniref:P-type conjugative transfer protein TrbJ n=5 Tax=Pseudomonadota TaxID=1224 RepID=A0A4Q8LT63_9GAMM|nr:MULTISPECIES: P-type conjugative transfer protein TrbJ [Pseudomonadota]EAA0907923.1 P-type conjugative transfer protein TrbJ [Salmonella enterica subsp. enterica serovar Kentucky]EAA1017129.1 P-type conjugative transfer protein TrbJ [Salmonella enterica subsp. enterica serovar Enteritidis]EAB1571996.1 P-type conjugative transfer protein TrbJ [Salmonella enterica]EAO3044605.1 P-type conjugative transfer protein TrbJ [Salmonella enterica subsp. enterica serovar Johannesburg]EBH3483875.1 P-typ
MNSIFRAKLRNGVLSAAVTASVALGAGFFAAPTPAYAIYCSNCSTFYQQMFEYAEAVNTTLNTAQQLQTQIQQYQNMVTQGLSLPNSMFGSIAADLQSVASIYTKSQALGRQIQNMDSQFNMQFPGFQSYLNSAAASAKAPASSTMPDRYEKWSEQGRDNVKAAMEAANLNTSTFESEDAQLSRMVARSQSAAGRMQAIQAGNEIASQNVQQLQKLRDLIATQINMQGNYMAQEQDRIQLDDALRQQRRSGTITQTGSNKGY